MTPEDLCRYGRRLLLSEAFWRVRLPDYDWVVGLSDLPRAFTREADGGFHDPLLAELILLAEDPAKMAYEHAKELLRLRLLEGHAEDRARWRRFLSESGFRLLGSSDG